MSIFTAVKNIFTSKATIAKALLGAAIAAAEPEAATAIVSLLAAKGVAVDQAGALSLVQAVVAAVEAKL